MTQENIALILGATGGAGYEAARALIARGWRIRALHRDPERARGVLPQAEWIAGDAMSAADVAEAAKGAALIFHGVNPPGYRNWVGLALPMLENTIAAAAASGARIALPGTVYNYGPDAFPLLAETAPQRPATRKGRIRAEMEARLRAASEQQGVKVLILRAGDFFGPHAGNSWFSQGMVRPGRALAAVTYPGRPEVGHGWAYLPDFAETFVRLIEREAELAPFESFHFGGHWFERGIDFAEQIRLAAGNPAAPIRRMPWTFILALAPFVTLFRELAEMRYLWKLPVRLDNAKLTEFLGAEPHTPIDVALARTLEGQGCLAA